MVLIACVLGLFMWLWVQSLQNNRTSYLSAIAGIPYLLILLYVANDVDRVPVYAGLLVVPALLFLAQKRTPHFFACALVLAALLACCLTPSIRIKR